MRVAQKAFTIVELLIVIVIIGILASITIVAYNGITIRAENTKTIAAVDQTIKLMEAYSSVNGSYPQAADSSSRETYPCVGTYPSSICASYTGTSANGIGIAYQSSSFDSKIQTIGTIPQPSTQTVTIAGQPTRGVFVALTSAPSVGWFLNGSGIDCGIPGAIKDYDSAGGIHCYYNLP